MKKDDDNKKKMFNFVKRLKESTRRSQNQLVEAPELNSNENSNQSQNQNQDTNLEPISSNENNPTEPSNVSVPESITESSTISPSSLKKNSSKETCQFASAKKANTITSSAESANADVNENNCSICLRENNVSVKI